jgi:hypothetical protein
MPAISLGGQLTVARMSLAPTETKPSPLCIDSMRAIYLLQRPFDSPQPKKRGFSNCTSGKEELELRMRNALHLSETSATATKSNKTAESASLGRQLAVPMKCSAPVSPSSVRPLPELFSEDSDDLPWNVSRAEGMPFRPPSATIVPSL